MLVEKPLMDLSLDLIPKLQDWSEPVNDFLKIFTQIGNKQGIALILLITFFTLPRSSYCVLITQLMIAGLIPNALKGTFRDGRPFYLSGEIEPIGHCSTSFGNPSGHATFAFSMFPSLFYIIYRETRYKKVWTLIALPPALFCAFLTSYSRVHLGMHSIDQVLAGSLIGTLLTTGMIIGWCEPMVGHLQRLGNQTASKKEKLCGIAAWSIFIACNILIAASVYTVGELTFDVPEAWSVEFTNKCGLIGLPKNSSFTRNATTGVIVNLMTSFFYFGIFLDSQCFGGLNDKWQGKVIWKRLLTIPAVILMLATLYPFQYVPSKLPYGVYVTFKLIIPLILFNLMLSCFFKLPLQLLRLIPRRERKISQADRSLSSGKFSNLKPSATNANSPNASRRTNENISQGNSPDNSQAEASV